MTRTPQHDSLALSALSLAICLSGCAMSPIVDGDGAVDSEPDGSYESNQGAATDSDEQDEDEGEGDNQSDDEPGSDVAPKPSQVLDAGSVKDAAISARDAGQDAATVKDAGRPSSGTTTPATDAGKPTTTKPSANAPMCRAATDCKQSCVPIGIINCCRDNGTCGCTWAPGAYCL